MASPRDNDPKRRTSLPEEMLPALLSIAVVVGAALLVVQILRIAGW